MRCSPFTVVYDACVLYPAGDSVAYLSMLENNKRDRTLSTLTRVARVLQIPSGLLFFTGMGAGRSRAAR